MSGGKRARAAAWAVGGAAGLATEVVDDDALGRRLLRAREALWLDPDLVADEELLRVGGRHALAQLAVLVLRLLLVRALRRRAHLAPLLAEDLLDVVRVELGVRRLHLLLALRREHVVRLLLRPRVLVLDEATSALDALSEHAVHESVLASAAEASVLVIAHRLSTVMHADEILAIDQGAVVERGTHQALLRRDGFYAKLVRQQLSDAID